MTNQKRSSVANPLPPPPHRGPEDDDTTWTLAGRAEYDSPPPRGGLQDTSRRLAVATSVAAAIAILVAVFLLVLG